MKKYWKFGLLAVTLAAFAACGDDSSSNASDDDGSSSASEVIMSSASAESPIVLDGLKANVASNGAGGEQLTLQGSIKTDPSLVPNFDDNDQKVYYNVDSVSFVATTVSGDKTYEAVVPVTLKNVTFPASKVINLASATDVVNLDLVEGCGDFRLYVWAYASDSRAAGVDAKYKFSSVGQIDFTKKCKAEPASSSSEPAPEACTEMAKNTITLSTKMGTDQKDLNLATGAAENPHVSLSFDGGFAILTAAAGVTISEEGNQDSFLYPETVCRETVAPRGAAQSSMEVEQGAWYVVKTADGQFLIATDKSSTTSDTKGDLIIHYYK